MSEQMAVVPVERIEQRILVVRGQKVMLSNDLANLYDVEHRVLVQAVKRNKERFPADFMFRLSKEEDSFLKSSAQTTGNLSAANDVAGSLLGKHMKYLP